MFRYLLLILAITALLIALWYNLSIPRGIGREEGSLRPCYKQKNCISSAETDKRYISPLPYHSEETLDQIAGFMEKHYYAELKKQTPRYMHFVVTTKVMRFKDDVEFLAHPKQGLIEVRSSSRLGYHDFNKNRMRIEKLRRFLEGTAPGS